VITRVAGTGTAGNSGDDGLATSAKLNSPRGVAVTAGGFLIADSEAHVVRKVALLAVGVITRVAGTGTAGNSGDDGPATNAQLNSPIGVAVTADGGFLITDESIHVVRKVSAAKPPGWPAWSAHSNTRPLPAATAIRRRSASAPAAHPKRRRTKSLHTAKTRGTGSMSARSSTAPTASSLPRTPCKSARTCITPRHTSPMRWCLHQTP
jgi:hypothetical protein